MDALSRTCLIVIALSAALPLAAQSPQPIQGTASVSGELVNASTGLPIRQTEVLLLCMNPHQLSRATTDASGAFSFKALPPCDYSLSARALGYVDAPFGQTKPGVGLGKPVTVTAGQVIDHLQFLMAPLGAISGRVVTQFGDPALGVRVEALRVVKQMDQLSVGPPTTAVCDDRGRFRIYGLPPGHYVLRALPSGPSVGESYVVVGLGTATAPELQRAGEMIAITYEQRARNSVSSETPVVAPVFYSGTLTLAEARILDLDVSQDLGDIDLQLQVVPTLSVSGTVARSDGPIPGDTVVSVASAGLCCVSSQVDSKTGAFALRGLVPGHYVLEARSGVSLGHVPPGNGLSDGPRFWASSEILVDSSTSTFPVTMTLALGIRVSGLAVGPDGTPLAPPVAGPGRTVTLSLVTGNGSSLPASQLKVPVDPSTGRFVFESVPPGHYAVTASSGLVHLPVEKVVTAGKDVLDSGLDVPSQGSIADLRVAFTDKRTNLSGTIYGASGKNGPTVYVVAFAEDSTYWTAGSRRIAAVVPDPTGHFQFNDLPAGKYHVAGFVDNGTDSWSDRSTLIQLAPGSASVSLQLGAPVNVTVVMK